MAHFQHQTVASESAMGLSPPSCFLLGEQTPRKKMQPPCRVYLTTHVPVASCWVYRLYWGPSGAARRLYLLAITCHKCRDRNNALNPCTVHSHPVSSPWHLLASLKSLISSSYVVFFTLSFAYIHTCCVFLVPPFRCWMLTRVFFSP